MALPVGFGISALCCTDKKNNIFENDDLALAPLALLGTDILTTITTLIVGILGACSVIAMPGAAAWTMVGVGAGIPAIYVGILLVLVIAKKCCAEEDRPSRSGYSFNPQRRYQ